RRYWAGTWEREWCVISHLVTAESGTVLVSGEGASAVELSAQVGLGSGPVSFVDLASKVGVTRSSGLALELIGERVTPFFRVLRLRRKFLRGIEAVYGEAAELRTAAGRPAEVPLQLQEET